MAKAKRKFSARIRRGTAVWLSLIGSLTALSIAWINHMDRQVDYRILIPVVGLVILPAVITYRNRTVAGWARHRRRYRKSSRDSVMLISYEGCGMVWDGHVASMYLEIHPPAYSVSVLNPNGSLTSKKIPVDIIREELVQFDIHTDHVTVFTVGQKYASATRLSAVYHATTGPVPALMYGKTYIEVSVALEGSLDSVYARMKNRTVPVGLGNTVKIAALRIKRRLNREGWLVDLLSRAQVKKISDDNVDLLVPMMRKERWQLCGDTSMSVTAHAPVLKAWNQSNYWEWQRFGSYRQLNALRLERGIDGADRTELYYCYVDQDIHALDLAEASGLRVEFGQQGNILTTFVPTAETVRPTEVPTRILQPSDPFPLSLYPCGIGVMVGFGVNRSQVYVDVSRGGKAPLYMVSPAAYLQQFLTRLFTTGATVDIRVPGEIWEKFAKNMKAPKIVGHDSLPDADVVIVPEGTVVEGPPEQVVIAWSTTAPAMIPHAIIVVSDKGCHVTIGNTQTPFQWTMTSEESRMLTVPRDGTASSDSGNGRHAAVASV